MSLMKYIKTAGMSARTIMNGGIACLFPGYLLRILYLVPLLLLWRTLIANHVDAGMTLSQMLAYTYLSTLLSDLLLVRTQATNWFYEGLFVSLYKRPLGVLPQLAAQTVGGWIPNLLFFALPMAAAAPLFGVSLIPASLWFFPSLMLCVSLGFAVDFLFASMSIRMRNATWLVYVIRNAVAALLSGSVIPFAVLPPVIGRILQLQPLGSLAGAPLSIFAGLAAPLPIIGAQVVWNLLLWPAAIAAMSCSRERMVSYGG